MPITVSWDNDEQTALYMYLSGKWTWDEYYPAIQEATAMMDSVDHQVDIIAELQSAHVPPRAVTQIGPATAYARHPHAGRIVLIGAQSTYLKMLVDLFQRIFPESGDKIIFASSLDEARAALAEQRRRVGKAV